jgi:hypothetical protein
MQVQIKRRYLDSTMNRRRFPSHGEHGRTGFDLSHAPWTSFTRLLGRAIDI